MQQPDGIPSWDFSPAIDLLRTLSVSKKNDGSSPPIPLEHPPPADDFLVLSQSQDDALNLGNFSRIWDFLSSSHHRGKVASRPKSIESDAEPASKEVRWRDEVSGADLEDNVDVDLERGVTASSLRTRKRAARRARARERTDNAGSKRTGSCEQGHETTGSESDRDLGRLRCSPDRRAVIQDLLGYPSRDIVRPGSPQTPSSPPKENLRVLRKERPVSNPFHWSTSTSRSGSGRTELLSSRGQSSEEQKSELIARLSESFPSEAKYLDNKVLIHPEFTPLNTSASGIHVFIDISNIMIGFHDCLKASREMAMPTRIRRVPMSFHQFSLVLERGRPAAKRVLVGSDRFPLIQQAKKIGYETNILERVHKVKEPSTRQKKFRNGGAASGQSSGSESNTIGRREKWVEQAVDEILHLKILESLIDSEEPSTIVLATGDGDEAEYSGGFMRMVERALGRGWMVELVSFNLNTSGAYKRKDFRSRWGKMFRWVKLDDYVEHLVGDHQDDE